MTEPLWDINDLAEYLKVCRRSAEKLAPVFTGIPSPSDAIMMHGR